jgi:hypothetical protein
MALIRALPHTGGTGLGSDMMTVNPDLRTVSPLYDPLLAPVGIRTVASTCRGSGGGTAPRPAGAFAGHSRRLL